MARDRPGYRPLVFSALDYAFKGDTSLAEVFALSGQVEDLTLQGEHPAPHPMRPAGREFASPRDPGI